MIKFLKNFSLICLAGLLAWGFLKLHQQAGQLESKFNNLKNDAQALQSENQNFKDKIDYLGHPENLLKEAKSLFNYHQPEEKMIIIPK